MSENQWMVLASARRLDVSQLLAYYNHSSAHLYNERACLDSQGLGSYPLHNSTYRKQFSRYSQ